MGKSVTLTAEDSHRLAGYRAEPPGKPRAGVVVIQEIFGVNQHIRKMTDGFAADGYLSLAPAIFDRVQRRMPARLLLIGDGPERSLAEKLAREGGYADRTTFLGNVAAIETILPAARLLLLPSDAESFGLAALEAMSCGVPVIGTAAGGLPEVVQDGVEGFLRPVGDVEGMSEGAIRLLEDDALWQRFSTAARLRAEREFPTDELVSRYRALYEKTLSG